MGFFQGIGSNKNTNTSSKSQLDDGFFERNMLQLDLKDYNEMNGTCDCQVLRSASEWSLGLQPDNTEMSI